MVAETQTSRLDDAARAGWLYFVAGNTQEEIARKLNVSRPTAQRLVSLALSERLITFRLEHPIAACMELGRRLFDRFGLKYCDIVPSDPASADTSLGIAESAAAFLERQFRSETPVIVALGTGRTLRRMVDQLPRLNCPSHLLLSLVGNTSPDGKATFFDVLTKLADLTQSPHFPHPLPVFASTAEERALYQSLTPLKKLRALADKADAVIVGIGQIDEHAQLFLDGVLGRDDLLDLMRSGAVGEIVGWSFDRSGAIVRNSVNDRVTSIPLPGGDNRLIVGVAMGPSKVNSIRAALTGGLVNGLITDETTAKAVLAG